MDYTAIGNKGVRLPRIVFGTSALGNLYRIHSFDAKLKIVSECIKSVQNPVFDTTGKYGAGLALETLGQCLKKLNISPDEYINRGMNPEEKEGLFKDITDACRALSDLRKLGKIKAAGIGSKDWEIISKDYPWLSI